MYYVVQENDEHGAYACVTFKNGHFAFGSVSDSDTALKFYDEDSASRFMRTVPAYSEWRVVTATANYI